MVREDLRSENIDTFSLFKKALEELVESDSFLFARKARRESFSCRMAQHLNKYFGYGWYIDAAIDGSDILIWDRQGNIPLALFTAVDSFYSGQMITLGLDEKCTGTIVYEEDRIHCEFVFPGLSVDAEHSFDYKAIFDITDPGTTVIPGIAELIAADREALE